MPNVEFAVPMRLETPKGTLLLNQPDAGTGEIYRVRHDTYKIVPALRVTQDSISQADGSVLHPRYTTGLVATLRVTYMVTESGGVENPVQVKPACGQQLREMHEFLMLCINSIRAQNPDPLALQRYFWTPTGAGDDRLIDDIEVLVWPDPQFELDGEEVSIDFAVESPFPYAIDATEIDTVIANGDTEVITNTGSAAQSPVVRVAGPFSGFTLTNADDVDVNGNPKSVVYDDARPGAVPVAGGHYAEIDFFRGTIFLDGSSTDLVAGISPTATDYWVLVADADNHVSISGADCTVLSNNAWA